MKRGVMLTMAMLVITGVAYASDYQGNEKQDSFFQKLGDLISGKYEVEVNTPLKDKGIIQVMADQINGIESGEVK